MHAIYFTDLFKMNVFSRRKLNVTTFSYSLNLEGQLS